MDLGRGSKALEELLDLLLSGAVRQVPYKEAAGLLRGLLEGPLLRDPPPLALHRCPFGLLHLSSTGASPLSLRGSWLPSLLFLLLFLLLLLPLLAFPLGLGVLGAFAQASLHPRPQVRHVVQPLVHHNSVPLPFGLPLRLPRLVLGTRRPTRRARLVLLPLRRRLPPGLYGHHVCVGLVPRPVWGIGEVVVVAPQVGLALWANNV
mmetsp:Transcript_2322/g.8403  ORF Transcript_2322/g.8403 Transcript_2322/m.8403 type:complete len:205 (-) Transcript_2322:502-1116(-)